ncbi:hypothetical protein AB0F92_22805 [Kitasatospora aureofaciens]|uniref:hypothetical protein n=1 Tax=Kitasatospora aureofaciens TaxID=1894 RepID=UPI00068F62CF|nr:hypothetical protein CP971_05640 [Streptomyces viridifaciens]UKZ04853.1 hypothetical protein BOQ63_012510 [Streptomyces viridifaciens]
MEFVAGPPARWHLTLKDGTLLELWADGYGIVNGAYEFSALVRATEEEQGQAHVLARTPSDSHRVMVAVARLATGSVQDVHTASRPSRDGACVCPGLPGSSAGE